MPNATVIHLPIRRDDACNYALVLGDFGKALANGSNPADAAVLTVADAPHATLNWPDEERRRYAESLEREVGRGK